MTAPRLGLHFIFGRHFEADQKLQDWSYDIANAQSWLFMSFQQLSADWH
jgi:hypothetical protein